MTRWLLELVAVVVLAASAPSMGDVTAEAAFHQGMAAVQSNDFASGLHYLEVAITDDPDSLRYSSEYRQAIIRHKDFDRSIEFFEKLLLSHPSTANLHLNCGFAYVDKLPVVGSITQVILANTALGEFSKAVDLRPSWIALYTRGESYLFWPRIFGKAPLGVADLEKALAIQLKSTKKSYYARVYVALGDGYCKMDLLDKARSTWLAGLRQFPDDLELKDRLAMPTEDLLKHIENGFDPNKRVDTDLRAIWSEGE